jgi:PAS domain S-box-containing protein
MDTKKNLILIIEDDSGLNDLISEQITGVGYECKGFSKARDAISWLKDAIPLLILLDYGLPDLTGNEFINELKNNGLSVPPFVVATGRGDERIAVEMMKLGARDYIVKDAHFLNLIQHVIYRVVKEIETERKLSETERELNELNRFNTQIIEGAKEGIMVYDKHLKYVSFNKFMEKLTGANAQEIIGKNIHDVFQNIKNDDIYECGKLALEGKESEIEFYFDISETGKSGWILNAFSPLRNADNEIIGVISIVHDITERKQSELALKVNHDLLQKLLYSSTDFIRTDSSVDYHAFLKTMMEISGAKYGAFNLFDRIGNDFRTIAVSAGQNDLVKVTKYLGFDIRKRKWKIDLVRAAKIKDQQTTRFENLRDLTGKVILDKLVFMIEKTFRLSAVYVVKVDSSTSALGDFTLMFTDKSELQNREIVELFANQVALYLQRNQSENEMKESENKFRLLFDENPQPMWVYDTETLKFLEINQAAIDHYGYSRDEFLNMTVEDIHHAENNPALFNDAKQSGLSINSAGEWRHIKKNGEVIDVKISSRGLVLNNRETRHVVIQDVTERKIAERALHDKMDELMRFHSLTVDRELTMIELKKEINQILEADGKPPKYWIVK